MARHPVRWALPSLLWLTSVLAACLAEPPALPPVEGDGSTGELSSSDSSGPGASSTPGTADATRGMDGATSVATSGTTGGPATTVAVSVTSSGESGGCIGPDAANLGDSCSDGCDCMSGECYVVGPLGGVCSECDSDEDCGDAHSGCNFGNPLNGTPAFCSDGSLGSGCETADACQDGLFCPRLIDIPGILSLSTCSTCESDADCMGMQLCAPDYDIETIAGFHHCVSPASIPNDGGCNLVGDGSECQSGTCAPAALMGIPVIGVCSPCDEDADCPGGGVCQLPEIGVDGSSLYLVPGQCF